MSDTERKPRKQCITPAEQDRLRHEIEQAILAGMSEKQISRKIRGTAEFKDLSRETIRNYCQRIRIRLGEIYSRSMSPELRNELIGVTIARYQHTFNLAMESGQLTVAIKANTCMAEMQGLTRPNRGTGFGAGLQQAAISNQQHHVAQVVKNLEDHAQPAITHAVGQYDG